MNAFKNYKDLFNNQNQKVGVISNYFTEVLLSRDYQVKKVTLGNYIDEIETEQIEVVFIENSIYEEDHDWYDIEFSEVVKLLSMLDVNIIIINTLDSPDSLNNNNLYQINMNDDIKKIRINKNLLEIPLVVNEQKFNPVEIKKSKDVLFFKWGNLEDDEKIKKYPVLPKPKSVTLETSKLTRTFIKNIISQIKSVKVIYIHFSENIPKFFLKYIEVIATLNHTVVIKDAEFNDKDKYIINTRDHDSNINYIQAYTREGLLYDKRVLGASREAFLNNTLSQYGTLNNIFSGNFNKKEIKVGVITSTMRKWTLDDWVERLNYQNEVTVEAVLLTHGFELDYVEKIELIEKANFDLKIITQSSDITLGECLNECIEYVESDYITKMDDDDFYYPNYLLDAWIAKKYSQASIVGKNAQFVYMEGENLTIKRFKQQQQRFTTYVAGGTIFCETSLLKEYKFSDIPRAVDTDLFNRVLGNGGNIFSNHPYEFCLYRSADTSNHTWQASETYVIRSSEICFYGNPAQTLTID